MIPTTDTRKLAVYLAPGQEALVRRVAAAGGYDIACAGSWVRGATAGLAGGLGVEPCDDLREMLGGTGAGSKIGNGAGAGGGDGVLIASAGDFGSGAEDVRAVAAAERRGVRVFSFETIPASLAELNGVWRGGAGGMGGMGQVGSDSLRSAEGRRIGIEHAILVLGLPRRSKVMREATETLAAFGAPRSVGVRVWGVLGVVPLGAKLVGAIDLVLSVFSGEEPAWVDAVYLPRGARTVASAGAGTVGRREDGDSLRGLSGDLSALVRMSDGRGAVMQVSDQGAGDGFELTMLSAQGRLVMTEQGFSWRAPDGSLRDEHRSPGTCDVYADGFQFGAKDEGPLALERVLTAAQTAILSARTGQPESPATIVAMGK